MFRANVMRCSTVLFLGVQGQTLPATVQFKTMLQYSGGAVLILVVQKTLIALALTETKWDQETYLNLM